MGRKSLKPKILNQASNEIRNQFLSARKIQRKIQWQPRHDFEDALQKTIGWYTAFLNQEANVAR